MNKGFVFILILSVIANAVLLVNVFSPAENSVSSKGNQDKYYDPDEFPLLSKRVFTEKQNDILINFVELREKLHEYQKKTGDDFGIYFEYLPSGVSVGVNDRKPFVLASLLKVPLAMAICAKVERGELSHDKELVVQKENLDPFFGDLWTKGIGTKITVQEAVELSITKSDNTATSLLFKAAGDGALESVFDYLDIPKELDGKFPTVTPKNYSSVLRSLYLASFITKEKSQNLLELLTRTEFNDKLVAGVPSNIKVAHKIGVYEPGSTTQSVYTDCGIVYAPLRPYVLCLMARTDEETSRTWFKDISKMVYEYVSTANNN